jgi:putative aldouronate transport system permease protein
MVIKRTFGERVFDGFNVIFLGLLMLVFIYPLSYVFFASISDPKLLVKHSGLLLFPQGFSLKGYEIVLKNHNILTGYMNTIFYVVVGTALNILMTSLGAYVLSRKTLYFKRFLMVMIVFTMYFGGGIIPTYIIFKSIGLMNSRLVMILPGAIATYNLIVMRTAFLQIPDGLEESAKIDGASDFVILFQIILPVSKAVIAVMVLFYSVAHWNAWFNAMIFLRDRKLYPLQLFLREILISNEMKDMTMTGSGLEEFENSLFKSLIKYCTIIVSTLPILFIYPFLQKYFAKGVMVGSLKG